MEMVQFSLVILSLSAIVVRHSFAKEKVFTNDLKIEKDPMYWRQRSNDEIQNKKRLCPNERVAKNIILFLGDGMSIPTLTASRIYLGQLANLTGEECQLSFERFPYTGLSKTYCANFQVADSGCSATAYLGGVKGNIGTIGVTASVDHQGCIKSQDPENQVDTILDWALEARKATGIVTGDKITGASPAGTYAHSASRFWESDYDMVSGSYPPDTDDCKDIALQLIDNTPGYDMKVIMGGGRKKFLPRELKNSPLGEGVRLDRRNLINEWKLNKKGRGRAEFIGTRQELRNLDINKTDYLLGLFCPDTMPFHLSSGNESPSLVEMTETAIKILRKEKNGFFLFVESALIDIAHHNNMARRALDETVELHKAVLKALELVDPQETLIVVTADHSHTMSMAGYSPRGTDILGLGDKSFNKISYTTLSYANGPSALNEPKAPSRIMNYDDIGNPAYQYPALYPLKSETHGGDDVAVFAQGPWAHLLVGNYEQTLIPAVMAYSAQIGPYSKQRPFKK